MVFSELAGRLSVADLPVGSLFSIVSGVLQYPDNKVIH